MKNPAIITIGRRGMISEINEGPRVSDKKMIALRGLPREESPLNEATPRVTSPKTKMPVITAANAIPESTRPAMVGCGLVSSGLMAVDAVFGRTVRADTERWVSCLPWSICHIFGGEVEAFVLSNTRRSGSNPSCGYYAHTGACNDTGGVSGFRQRLTCVSLTLLIRRGIA